MLTQNCDAVLAEAASEVLETMYFTSVFGTAETEAVHSPEWQSAALSFKGETRGSFGVNAPANTIRTLAANFMGVEEGTTLVAEQAEVLCELCNMLCGAALLRLAGDTRFELSHPEIQPAPRPSDFEGNIVRTTLQLDAGILEIWLAPA